MTNRIVSQHEWVEARKALMEKEKAFTRARDALTRERQSLPWVKVDKQYEFEGPDGEESLSDLFDGRSQLLIYHFMMGPDWEEGCKSCSFWADNYDGIIVHLKQRDVTPIVVSRAPFEKLEAFRKRMGWTFKWVSSYGSDFNADYQVSFSPEALEKGEVYYNYQPTRFPSDEAPGVSVFYKDGEGQVFHTYSCYARGLDMLNSAYNYLDLVPKGRDEDELEYPMAWVRHHDRYED